MESCGSGMVLVVAGIMVTGGADCAELVIELTPNFRTVLGFCSEMAPFISDI